MALTMLPRDPRSVFLSDPATHASLRKALSRRVPADQVDDVAQATMLEAHASPTYPIDRAGFMRWLRLKAVSNATDWLRRQSRSAQNWGAREGEDAEALPAMSFVAENEARERLRFVEAHLRERPGRGHRVRWLLARAQGESFGEIASKDGVAAKTVERAVQRLQKDLRSAWIVTVAAIALFLALRALLGPFPHRREARPRPAPSVPTAPPIPLSQPVSARPAPGADTPVPPRGVPQPGKP